MSRAARELLSILERERVFLRAGELDRAAGLARRKEACIETVERDGAGTAAEALGHAAAINMELLAAAREGLASARDRIEALQKGVSTKTYSSNGERTEIAETGPTLERRA